MPKAPPREPFYVLAARYLSRLAGLERGDGAVQHPAPGAGEPTDEHFRQMIGFSPEASAAQEAQQAAPPPGRGSGA